MRRATRPDLLAPVALFAGSTALQLPFLDRGFSPIDEGSMLAIAEALAEGAVLYRDHATFISPFMYELMSVLLAVFGEQLWVGRWFQALVLSASVVVVYAIVRHFASVRVSSVAAASLLAVKPLALPMWTVPNYNQLSMLFALLAGWATLRSGRDPRVRWLGAAGLAIGMAVVTKLSLGGGTAIACASAVAAGRFASGERWLGDAVRRVAILAGVACVPVAATVAGYAAQGAFEPFVDRTLLSLVGVSSDMRIPFPTPWPWNASGAELFRLQYEYFPSPVFSWSLLRDVKLYASAAGPAIETFVKLVYYGPVLATFAAAVIGVRGLREREDGADVWLLVAGLSAFSYASTAHRLDFAHILNIAPAPWLACAIVLNRWRGPLGRGVTAAALGVWLLAGVAASWVVLTTYDTAIDTPRGRLRASAEEAEDATTLLRFLDAQPRDAQILLMRTLPIYYFLADRPIPGVFDLYLPAYFLEGEDARTAARIADVDLVVYDPNDLLGLPKPITEFAPATARALADRFEVAEILSPTAVVMRPRATPIAPSEVVVEIARDFARVRTPNAEGRVTPETWLVYPVVTSVAQDADGPICFVYPHTVGAGERLQVRPMFKHVAWTARFWPDAARRARASVEVLGETRRESVFDEVRRAGLPGAPVEVDLAPFAGTNVRLRFCTSRHPSDRRAGKKATFGWADPRIVRDPPAARP